MSLANCTRNRTATAYQGASCPLLPTVTTGGFRAVLSRLENRVLRLVGKLDRTREYDELSPDERAAFDAQHGYRR